jgi:hypothetical protein
MTTHFGVLESSYRVSQPKVIVVRVVSSFHHSSISLEKSPMSVVSTIIIRKSFRLAILQKSISGSVNIYRMPFRLWSVDDLRNSIIKQT